MQRVGALTALPRLLRARGVNPESVMRAAELPGTALQAPDNRIPYVAAVRLMAESARQTGCQHFGLVAAQEWRLRHLGLVGELTRSCATLGDALQTLVAYQQLNAQGGAPYLLEFDQSVELGYLVFHPNPGDTSSLFELTLGVGVIFIRELCGEAWNPREVTLPCSRPVDLRPYRDHFRCRLRFDAERAAFSFPKAAMEQAVAGGDPARKRALEGEAQRLLDKNFMPLLYRVLRELLARGTVSAEATAQELALHRRTFTRRLQAHGVTFQAVLDEVRYEVARQLLRDTKLPIVKIAEALCYAEASSFNHAFRRWSGQSPSDSRAQAKFATDPAPASPAVTSRPTGACPNLSRHA